MGLKNKKLRGFEEAREEVEKEGRKEERSKKERSGARKGERMWSKIRRKKLSKMQVQDSFEAWIYFTYCYFFDSPNVTSNYFHFFAEILKIAPQKPKRGEKHEETGVV